LTRLTTCESVVTCTAACGTTNYSAIRSAKETVKVDNRRFFCAPTWAVYTSNTSFRLRFCFCFWLLVVGWLGQRQQESCVQRASCQNFGCQGGHALAATAALPALETWKGTLGRLAQPSRSARFQYPTAPNAHRRSFPPCSSSAHGKSFLHRTNAGAGPSSAASCPHGSQ